MGLLLCVPVLVAFYPPMTDLPYHEAAVGLLRHFDDPSLLPPGLYQRNLGEPNQLFHLAAWALSYLVSTRWSVKLVVALAVGSLPVSTARLARHLGADPLAAVVSAPIALGWLFSWGFVTNLVGLSLLLAALPTLDRFAAAPTPRGALRCAAASVLLYFGHETALLVFGGFAFLLLVLRPSSRREVPLRATPLATSIALVVGQALWQQRYMTPILRETPVMWTPLANKLAEIPSLIVRASDAPSRLAVTVLWALVMASFFWLRAREGTARQPAHEAPLTGGIRAAILRRRWELLAGGCAAGYLAMPLTLNGASLVYQRWFAPAFILVSLLAAPRVLRGDVARVPCLLACVLPVAVLVVTAPAFADSDRSYRAFETLLPYVQPGSAVADVGLTHGDPTRSYSLQPAGGRILATRGGRLAVDFTYSAVSPVVIPARYQWNEPLVRLGLDSLSFRPAQDLRRFRYLLVRVDDGASARAVAHVLRPEADFIAAAGEWVLFQSRLAVVPLLSPDEGSRGGETLRDRLQSLP
jgi:hypothetical protein